MMDKISNCLAGYTRPPRRCWCIVACVLISAGTACKPAYGQISATAYRALGQSDLARNGLNRVQGTELFAPGGIAVDFRAATTRLYISDTHNHRVLGWADARAYQAGDPPAIVLGQVSVSDSSPLGTGATGLSLPAGVAVDPLTGNVYVADTGNNRVLRFSDPFRNTSRVEPDAVYGQTDINGRTANGTGNGRNGLRSPLGVAVDSTGNLWIADTGNHRILRYSAGTLESSSPAADLVIGQKDFADFGSNRSGAASPVGFDSPSAVAFDREGQLYVSDTGNRRVLRFKPPFLTDSSASTTIPMPGTVSATPAGLAVSDSLLYVALPRENRIIVFTMPANTTPTPANVFGQSDLNGRDPNAGVSPRSAAYTLSSPADVKIDGGGNVYIADAGNHRVLRFAEGSRSANQVWGQFDFSSNSPNQVKPTSLNTPSSIAVDYSREPFALYVADTANHRVLIWKDAARFRSGDPADGAIGQADLRTAFANFDGDGRHPTRNSLFSPRGIAVDAYGNVYVADSGNNRVLRFPRPVDQPGVPAADVVLGQPDFTAGAANGTSPMSLRSPTAVAIGPEGEVFVSDTGNNRVLEFPAYASTNAAASRVYGQPNFASSVGPRVVSAQTLTRPGGIAVDHGFNLYVADSGANRVVMYANTRDASAASNVAAIVIGSDRFDAIATGTSRTRLQNPSDVVLDSSGRVYVTDAGNHRVLVFPSLIFLPITDGAATSVIGQLDFNGNTSNWNSRDGLATAESLAAPAGVFVDRRDTVYIADAGNHRILHFLKSSRIYHGVYRQASALGRGALVTIEGEGLAEAEATSSLPLANTLADREVVVNDTLAAPLISVSFSNINLQLPATAPTGASRLAVRVPETSELIAGGSAAVASYAPGLNARVLNQDGGTNSESSPAVKGSTIRILGTGQGPVSPAVADGEAVPEGAVQTIAVPTSDGNTCLTRQPSVCVAIGNTFGEVKFSGLATGAVGVWQLDVRIPDNAPSGNIPVRAVINAVPSNIVTVAIR
jgi:uncharacterized protein (TIGR03437 family)